MDNFEFKSFLKRRIITYSKRVLKEGTDYEASVYGETLADTVALDEKGGTSTAPFPVQSTLYDLPF